MTDPVGILGFNGPYEDNTINGQGICTFSTVESEIPAFAATSALVDSKSSRPVNMEGSVREVLGKHTVLKKKEEKRKSVCSKLHILGQFCRGLYNQFVVTVATVCRISI